MCNVWFNTPLRPCLVPHVFSINGIASLSFGWVMDTYSMLPPCCLETPGLQAYTEPKLRPEPQCWSASEVFDPMPNRFQSWSPPQSRGKNDIWDTERIWMNLKGMFLHISPLLSSTRSVRQWVGHPLVELKNQRPALEGSIPTISQGGTRVRDKIFLTLNWSCLSERKT